MLQADCLARMAQADPNSFRLFSSMLTASQACDSGLAAGRKTAPIDQTNRIYTWHPCQGCVDYRMLKALLGRLRLGLRHPSLWAVLDRPDLRRLDRIFVTSQRRWAESLGYQLTAPTTHSHEHRWTRRANRQACILTIFTTRRIAA